MSAQFECLKNMVLKIWKLRREVCPVEQDTIGCEYLAYFDPEKIQKTLSKAAYFRPPI
jgi:hypothetical protein